MRSEAHLKAHIHHKNTSYFSKDTLEKASTGKFTGKSYKKSQGLINLEYLLDLNLISTYY